MKRMILIFVCIAGGIIMMLSNKADRIVAEKNKILTFNNSVTRISSHAFDERFKFTRYFEMYRKGQEISIGAMELSRDELEETIGADVKRIEEIDLPDDDTCRVFHRDSLANLANLLDIVAKYKTAIAYVAEHNPGSKSDFAALQNMFKDLHVIETELQDAVQASQKKMMDNFKIEYE